MQQQEHATTKNVKGSSWSTIETPRSETRSWVYYNGPNLSFSIAMLFRVSVLADEGGLTCSLNGSLARLHGDANCAVNAMHFSS